MPLPSIVANSMAGAYTKKFVEETAVGLGAVKGAPCTIKSIEEVDGGQKITFSWTGTNGTTQTASAIFQNGTDGKDGVDGKSIPTFEIDDDGNLVMDTDSALGASNFSLEDGVLYYTQPEGTKVSLGNVKGDTYTITENDYSAIANTLISKLGSAEALEV